MENYHLFVVDEQSLKIHIEYGFVATGRVGANFSIGLWKDIQRLKIGDKVIFYVQGIKKFFGIFQVSSDPFFENSNPLYLSAANPIAVNGGQVELRYRSLISPYRVFANGIGEFDLVDVLPSRTRDVLWSVLYRKLKAKRGNSPLFPSEFDSIQQRLSGVNNNTSLNFPAYSFLNGQIQQGMPVAYDGNTGSNVDLKTSIIRGNYSEHHLHAFLLGRVPSSLFGANCSWLGNEVYAGAGMQAIDLMSIVKVDGIEQFWPIEVKKEVVPLSIFEQIEKYCRWITGRFELANPAVLIQPVLVGKRGSLQQKRKRSGLKLQFDRKGVSLPLKYFEYSIDKGKNEIVMDEIDLSLPQFPSVNSFRL